jgi:hypothetical protein
VYWMDNEVYIVPVVCPTYILWPYQDPHANAFNL